MKCIKYVFAAVLLVLFGCTASQRSNVDIYRAAVEDAKVATSAEISRNLIGISSPKNKNNPPLLLWKSYEGVPHVLVCSWVGERTQNKGWQRGQRVQLDATDNIWVTAVPELKLFYKKNRFWPSTHEKRVLRTEQVLGLPEGSNHRAFIEFWVNPADIFRPSADPDPTDHEAQLRHPWGSSVFQLESPTQKILVWQGANQPAASYSYTEWFEQLRKDSYSGNPAYPWTRLGYTYDWAEDGHNNDHRGLSEFIVRGGTTLYIEQVVDTESLESYFLKP
ncbi:MAG: hypothetical protein ACNI27_01500 [Desulfovibrio sp.]